MSNTIGSVLNGRTREIAAHFEDLHPSLDLAWFASLLDSTTTLSHEELCNAMRTAYTRCKESFDPAARVKAHAPTVVATKHVREAITHLSTAKEYGL